MFGCMWGVGNVSYGLTMRYLGMSLGIGVAIGVTLVVGTLIPPFIHGQGGELISTRGGLLTLLGVAVALCGIVIVSVAGHRKEIALGAEIREFDVRKGLMLAVMCGIFSSGMSFAIDAARPIQASAILLGVKPLYAALPSYVIIMGGGGLVNFADCFSRLFFKKELSLRADLGMPSATLLKNGSLAATGGIMWYLQFFFYAGAAAAFLRAMLCELDAAYEWLCFVLVTGQACAWGVGRGGQQAGSPALGGNGSYYCGSQYCLASAWLRAKDEFLWFSNQ